MAKLVRYKCEKCGHVFEEIYMSSEEEIKQEMECEKCHEVAKPHSNWSSGSRWRFCDVP